MVAILDSEDLLESKPELIGLGRLEVLVFEQGLQLFFLLDLEVSLVLEPEPASFLEDRLGDGFPLAYGIHGLIDELHEVEAIEGDLGIGQVLGGPFLEGRREVHAHLGDGLGTATMGLQILGELCEGLSILARCGKVRIPRKSATQSS